MVPKTRKKAKVVVLSKLHERLITNRIKEQVEGKFIAEQAGLRPGKSCTGQVLNHCQHFEDGYKNRNVTGFVLVDLSAAYQ